MGKTSRKSIAADLGKSEIREGEQDVTKGLTPTLAYELSTLAHELSTPAHEGLVVLNSRRPPQERSPRSKSRRDAAPNKVGEEIGAHLRNIYNDVLEQPVPERFIELLNQLETGTISPARPNAPGEK
jgi:hypothetical protein